MNRWLLLLIMLTLAAVPSPAQLRISGLEALAARAKESVNINLDANLMQLAAGFLSQQDKDQAKVKALLGGITAINVRSFEFEEEGQYRAEDIEPIRAQLRGPGWSQIVSVQEKGDQGESAEIYTRMDQGKVAGFAIITAEPKELTIVAIEGAINLEDLAQLGGQFGIPQIPVQKNKQKGKDTK